MMPFIDPQFPGIMGIENHVYKIPKKNKSMVEIIPYDEREVILRIQQIFDQRLLALRTGFTNDEFLQREEELNYLRRVINEALMEAYRIRIVD